MLAGLREVETSNEQSTVRVHCQSGRSEPAGELVEHRSVINAGVVAYDPKNAVHSRLGHINHALVVGESQAARVRQLAVNNGLQHANAQIDGEDRTGRRLNGSFAERSTVRKVERVVLLRENHGVRSLERLAVEVLDDRLDLDALVDNRLTEDGLVRLISDEGRALVVEDEAGGLTAGREGDLHLAFGSHVVDVAVGRDEVEVAFLVLGRAEERHGELEELLVVGLSVSYVRHLKYYNS